MMTSTTSELATVDTTALIAVTGGATQQRPPRNGNGVGISVTILIPKPGSR